ncbi:hypothetical protein C8F04DRAFT_1403985 [Mycena alexandri]|uniref:Uncharacterized protein n=1 Tax=Mycena alexandri TaxID=1745969 RepID=A0AAD6WP13_9AGAR|nr:hypothetical protein C8F04DRAFT_1403985 [Mycena alexandri]
MTPVGVPKFRKESAHLPVAPFHILSRNLAYKCPSVFRGVNHLFLYTTKDTSKVDAVLAAAACASLTDLLVFLYVPLRGNLPTLASMPSLRRLVIQPRTLLAFDPDHPVFRTLTHLELLEISASAEAEDACTKLRLMPKLTRLILNSIEIYHALSPSREAFDHLRCIVLLSSEERREMGVDEVPAPLAEAHIPARLTGPSLMPSSLHDEQGRLIVTGLKRTCCTCLGI